MIEYDDPHAFFLFLVLPFILWGFLHLYWYRENKLKMFASERVLSVVVLKRRSLSFWSQVVFALIGSIGLVVALAGPKGNAHYVYQEGSDQINNKMQQIIFLIDVSASMAVNDMGNGMSRLDSSKEVVDKVIRQLKGESVALFAFTSATMQLSPLSTDYFFVRFMLRDLKINEEGTVGTDLSQALENVDQMALSLYQTPKTLVLLTDGGEVFVSERAIENLKSIKTLQTLIIGMGSETGGRVQGITYQGKEVISKLELSILEGLKKSTNATFFIGNSKTTTELASTILSYVNQQQGFYQGQKNEGISSQLVYDYYFQVPLGVALIAWALFLLIPNTAVLKRSFVFCLFVLFQFSYLTADPSSMMRQGALFFEAGDYRNAYDQYQALLALPLPEWQLATVAYNMGTVFLKEGKWREAIDQFESALEVLNLSPVLEERILINIATGTLMIAEEKKTAESIKLAFDAVLNAKEASCALEIAEGNLDERNTHCEQSIEITQLFGKADLLKKAFLREHKETDLRTAYLAALTQNVITDEDVASLEQMGEKANKNEMAPYLKKAKALLLKGDGVGAHMLLEMALNSLQPKIDTTLKGRLNTLIDQQTLALQLNRLEQQRKNEAPLTFSLEMQKEAIKTASQFQQEALTLQKSDFSKQGEMSASVPWEEIIPLFSSGQEAAKSAQKQLEDSQLLRAASFQIQTLRKWTKVLVQLEAAPASPDSMKKSQALKSQVFGAQLKMLQEMEEEDKSRPILLTPSTKIGEEKPW